MPRGQYNRLNAKGMIKTIHSRLNCPINSGARIEMSEYGLITACLKNQKPKAVLNFFGQYGYQPCKGCINAPVVRKYKYRTDLQQIIVPRGISIIPLDRLEGLKRGYEGELHRFKPKKYDNSNAMPTMYLP